MSEAPQKPVTRFGVFELDLAARQLRKNGTRVKLQDQPFRVLQLLVERPGEVVTREELKEKVWSEDTFVEFDHSLNTSIQKIRNALGDSANSPRFVETVPRYGYRFLPPVACDWADKSTTRGRNRLLALAAAAILFVIAVGISAWLNNSTSIKSPQYTLRQLTFGSGIGRNPAISPDGNLLAYASDRAAQGNLDIWVKQIGGGEPVQLTDHPADEEMPSFSPDGQLIVFYSARDGGGLYIKPTLGGDTRLLTHGAAWEPRFSPDGRYISFGNYGGAAAEPRPGQTGSAARIWVIPSEGGQPKEIHPDKPPGRRLILTPPVWLSDSEHMLVGSNRSENWLILDVDGGPPIRTEISEDWLAKMGFERRVTAPAADIYMNRPSAWRDRSSRIILAATHGSSTNLWSIPISVETGVVTGEPERLTFGSGPDLTPSLAHNGRIVFANLPGSLDLASVPVEPNTGRVTGSLEYHTSDDARYEFPVVSRDGSVIAAVSNRSGDNDIWLQHRDTNEWRQLTFSGTKHWQGGLAFSPDGSEIAFLDWGSPVRSTYTISTKDGAQQKVAEIGRVRDWLPDGSGVLLQGPEGATALDKKTGNARLLAEGVLSDPRASSDGRWVAFHWLAQPNRRQIFVSPIRGDRPALREERIPITDGEFNEFRPVWSPDGTLLYFVSERDGYACIWAQRLNPRTKTPVGPPFEVYGFHQTTVTLGGRNDGIWLSMAPDRIVFNVLKSRGNIWMLEPVEETQ